MTTVDFIRRKRDGGRHDAAEIRGFIDDFIAGLVPDYQMSAWLMAALLQGLDDSETVALTEAMLHSGRVLEMKSVKAPKIDKHSTGGVGDKVSLCLAPLVAACGVAVPMISGRGLGHTGGTLDKLEAIAGYDVSLDSKSFERVVRQVGASMIGQTPDLAPADRRIYALRDVTATVEAIPLIVASILSKKLAEGIDGLVLDVKVGRGAFMRDVASARKLARALVKVGTGAKKKVRAVITDMSAPLGRTIGNALETREAIDVLRGAGPADTVEITLALGSEMLVLGGVHETGRRARLALEQAIETGRGLERFERMVEAHGGDAGVVRDPSKLPRAPITLDVRSPASGFVQECDALELGLLGVAIGAGRTRADQDIDPAVGIELLRVRGERAKKGEPLARLHLGSRKGAQAFAARARAAFKIGQRARKPPPLILERITR